MKKCVFAVMAIFVLYGFTGKEVINNMLLWYNKPAANWNEALPIGNGRMGAMVFGGIVNEHLQLNDNTLYSGEPSQSYNKVNVVKDFDKVMALIKAGNNAEADEFIRKNWLGRLHANYEPLGDLFFKMDHSEKVTSYRRELDIAHSVLHISYVVNGVKYTREYFASHPDSVIVARFTASKPVMNITASFASVHPTAKFSMDKKNLIMKGQAPGYSERRVLTLIEKNGEQYKHPELFDANGKRKFDKQSLYGDEINGLGTYFEARLNANLKDGNLKVDSNSLNVKNCSEVTFVLSYATSFNGFDKSPSKEGKDPSGIAKRILDKADTKPFIVLKSNHETDYRNLFDRVDLNLTSAVKYDTVPTDHRLANFKGNNDPKLVELLFQYGRYLMISGSRKGGQPLNLQGIWNDLVIPPWNSGYTININTEMNYWPAEVTNLAECEEPLFRMIKEMAVTGSETAKLMYNRRGWVAHHNVSIWRETFPNDGNPSASFWNMSGGWLLSQMWEHYLYSGDEKFLKNEAYPLMKGAAMFYSDWLIDDGKGHLVTAAGNSPENVFINAKGEKGQVSSGPTMDMTIVRELFTRTIETAKKFNLDPALVSELQGKLDKLAPFQIGSKGQILEWQQEYKENEPNHRHVSFLYGLHPGNQINFDSSPELTSAAKQSLLLRGDAGTGWSLAWKISMWARLQDGEHAYSLVRDLFNPVNTFEMGNKGGGLYNNLLDACPPFQIDGNFGFTSGVAEMLIQSQDGYIQLLPALPKIWASGEVKGLVARGGFVIDMKWKDGKVVHLSVYSKLGGDCRIKIAGEMSCKEAELHKGFNGNGNPLLAKPVSVPFVNLSGKEIVKMEVPSGKMYEWGTDAGKMYTFEVKN